jgi:hypothetical protein
LVSNSTVQAYVEQKEPISTLENPHRRRNSFQKLTQFSQGNNLLGAPASITDDFVREIHVFLHLS